MQPNSIVKFWENAGPEAWFEKNHEFDAEVNLRFHDLPDCAMAGQLDHWTRGAEGSLALILILDQFPRNLHRNSAKAYLYDERAREIAKKAIAANQDQAYELPMRPFFYLPFMHSENLGDQEFCISLYEKANDPRGLEYAELHADIIRKFGRFPHRNEILNRISSTQELEFLQSGGFHG